MSHILTKEESFELAKKKVKELSEEARIELEIMPEYTEEFEFGWVFFYQSSEYVKTLNLEYLVGGNAPIIVDKFNSFTIETGTGYAVDFYIEKYCKFRNDIPLFLSEISH